MQIKIVHSFFSILFIERSLMDQISVLSEISGDVAKGDYVAVLIDTVTLMQGMRRWIWPVRIALQVLKWFLQIIHPVSLWIMWLLSPFFSSGSDGGVASNMQKGVQAGASTLQRALSTAQHLL